MSTCGRCCRSTNAKALARTISSAFNDLVSRLTPELLRKPITYRNSVGDQFTSTIEDILTQSRCMRRIIAARSRHCFGPGAATPSPTDYIAFTRGAPTTTRQG